MRRPSPLPTPPQREPQAAPVVEEAVEPARKIRIPARAANKTRAAVVSQDDIETDVDVETLPAWTRSHEGVVDPDADTDVIDDGGVFVRDRDEAPEQALAPVLPLEPDKNRKRAARTQVDEVASVDDTDEPENPTRWRDVVRASRAHRKALRTEARRFTVRSRRRKLTWIVSLSAVVAVVAGSFAIAYSPLFAVEKITVTGASSLDTAAVEGALAGHLGSPLAAIDAQAIKKQLATFPAIETYAIEAQPPHGLVINIVERTPVGVVAANGGFDLVDAAGVTLAHSDAAPEGQPVISVKGGADTPAFEAVGLVIRSVPASIRPQLASATATSAHDVTLTLAGTGTTIVWGSVEQSAKKGIVLESIMADRPPAQVTLYDVSTPASVIVR